MAISRKLVCVILRSKVYINLFSFKIVLRVEKVSEPRDRPRDVSH